MARRGGTNRFLNPSFETTVTGAGWGGATVTRVNTQAFAGAWSLKVDVPTASGAGYQINLDTTGLTLTGVPHLITGRVRVWAPTGQVVSVMQVNVNYTDAGVSFSQSPPITGNNAWQEMILPPIATDPTKTISTIVLYVMKNTAAVFTFYLDGIDIRYDEPDCDTYIDGTLGTGYAWTGTAHASTSTRSAIVAPEPPVPTDYRIGKNWLPNPSLEVDTAGWLVQANAVLSQTTEAAVFGTKSAKVVSTGLVTSQALYALPLTGFALTGVAHTIRVRARIWVTSGFAVPTAPFIYVSYSSGAYFADGGRGVVGTGGWQIVEYAMTTDPALTINAINIYPIAVNPPASSAFVYYFDAIEVRIDEPNVDSYIDGDQGSRYAWTGTAHASPSTRSGVLTPAVPISAPGSLAPSNPDAPWSDGPTATEFIIAKPGFVQQVRLAVSAVTCSWQVEGQAAFSAEARLADVQRRFGDLDLRGYWLYWNHPTLGAWAGEIGAVEAATDTQTLEIAAKDFSALLSARRITKLYDVRASPAGGLAKRVVRDAGRESGGYTWIADIAAEEMGPPVTLTLRGGQVDQALRTVSGQSGHEWWVDPDRVLHWSQHRGRDLTGAVQLVEGRHISAARYTLALEPIVNDLLAIPADQQYADSEQFVIDDDASIRRFGRRQDQIVYAGFVTESTLRPLAAADLKKLTRLGDAVRFELANVDGCWASFREGDTVFVLLPSLNKRLRVRVMVRSYDSDQALLSISGDVEGSGDAA